MSSEDLVPYALVEQLAAQEGITSVATMAVPAELPSERLDAMLADGVGDMGWLADRRELRLQPQTFWPGARSLVVATLAYQPTPLQADGLQRKPKEAPAPELCTGGPCLRHLSRFLICIARRSVCSPPRSPRVER